ncbi:hypothetical protein [Epilithonimonas tenax]|uniref:hypothetical protein n=1 Tax=Epilithonimonas tenax TaxID=191577 RepID=UPI000485C6FB|nr:hypothetical protein [Epilithonimonas tenax]
MFRKIKISYWFFVGLMIWAAVAYLRKLGIVLPFINDHLTDLYSVPMYSYTIRKIMNYTYSPNWRPDLKFLAGAALNLAVVFEVVFPLLSARYTADMIDVVCYFAGAMIYYVILREKERKTKLVTIDK